jgi:hypothetical protein
MVILTSPRQQERKYRHLFVPSPHTATAVSIDIRISPNPHALAAISTIPFGYARVAADTAHLLCPLARHFKTGVLGSSSNFTAKRLTFQMKNNLLEESLPAI